jgi:small subunit ribosomal protein S4
MDLPGLSRKTIERRPTPPGQHGATGRRGKLSTFGLQLKEKQKLRFNYGVTERQLRRYVHMAFAKKGNSGHLLLQLLERRLDSVVFRAGFAPTIPAARQLVSHGHIRIAGKRVDIPSYLVEPGEIISLSEKGMKLPVVVSTIEQPPLARPSWLGVDAGKGQATVVTMPDRETFPFPIKEQMIVEFYSQRG